MLKVFLTKQQGYGCR